MAKNISLLGADYPDVPAVVLPKTGGGSATFVDADDIGYVEDALAIVINGDTAPQAISKWQYLFIKNHSTLATGGYHATAAITSGGTVSSSNVAADSEGIANAINDQVAVLNNYKSKPETGGYVDLDSCTTIKQVMDAIDACAVSIGVGHTGNQQNTNFKTLVGATSMTNYDAVYVSKVGHGIYMAVASSENTSSAVKVKYFRRATFSYNDESRMSQTQWMAFNT